MRGKQREAMMVAVVAAATLTGFGMVAAWRVWREIPESNTQQTHFDVLLVLGTPCNKDGSLAPEQRARVDEGVREWRRGVAPVMIISGGPSIKTYVEADRMARYAVDQGVPRSVILEERQARNTVENVYFTSRIMERYGWRSVEVVSTWSHLPRASFILAHFPLVWRTHAAPWPPEFGWFSQFVHDWREALYTAWLRFHGLPRREYPVKKPFLPQSDVLR